MNAFNNFITISHEGDHQSTSYLDMSLHIRINHGDQQSYQHLGYAQHDKQDTRQNKIKIKHTKM
jgi:hypothetical protein